MTPSVFISGTSFIKMKPSSQLQSAKISALSDWLIAWFSHHAGDSAERNLKLTQESGLAPVRFSGKQQAPGSSSSTNQYAPGLFFFTTR